MEAAKQMPTIAVLKDLPDMAAFRSFDDFAVLMLMCSTLGRTVRCTLQNCPSKPFPPWDCRSDFAKVNSILLSFENMQTAGDEQLPAMISDRFATYEGYDRQKVGHFVWSRGLYHVCGCILNHALLLHKYRHRYRADVPRVFARECLDRCKRHAAQLTAIVHAVQTKGCCARGSFLAYFATVAASVHRLHEHSLNEDDKATATLSLEICLNFLEKPPVCWENSKRMVRPSTLTHPFASDEGVETDLYLQAAAIRDLILDPAVAQALVDPFSQEYDLDVGQLDRLWLLIDYGWLSDATQTAEPIQHPNHGVEPDEWYNFDATSPKRRFGFTQGVEGDVAFASASEQGLGFFPTPGASMGRDWWSSVGDVDSPSFQDFLSATPINQPARKEAARPLGTRYG